MILSTIVLLPGLSALIALIGRHWFPKGLVLGGTCALLTASAILTVGNFSYLQLGVSEIWFPWFHVGPCFVQWSVSSDALVAAMLVVVTFVSTAVHFYSIGYMAEDPDILKFMSFLGLFTFLMLLLVTANNLVQLFLGWEGVGLASYLLIGFWYEKPAAAAASFKAFVVNRIGDIGLMLGICLLYLLTGSVYYESIFHVLPQISPTVLTIIAFCFLIGAMGKSAQLGLHVWLPDAMEGPTPVSALIHAATMVTAGIFMIIRFSPLFQLTPLVLDTMIVLGTVTALFAALTALVQTDIKRIIAYSTCSQLGYMMMACGLMSFNLSAFHLFTHAFFKALLFLGAGSVIHTFSGEQDIRHMGGVYRHTPYTYAFMWVGSLALAGIPGFAGYYSKDAILMSAWMHAGTLGHFAFSVGLITAGLTAFYSFRLLFQVFHGHMRASEHVAAHIHESPSIMLIPLLFLTVGSLVVGPITLPFFTETTAGHWHSAYIPILAPSHHPSGFIHHAPTIVATSGIFLAALCYLWHPEIPTYISSRFTLIHRFFYEAFRFDALYARVVVFPFTRIASWLRVTIDQRFIDRFGPHGLTQLASGMATYTRQMQSGFVHDYLIIMVLAICLAILYMIVRN